VGLQGGLSWRRVRYSLWGKKNAYGYLSSQFRIMWVSFLSLKQILKINFKRENICFGSEFCRIQSIIGWPHCFVPAMVHYGRSTLRSTTAPDFMARRKERKKGKG
jgi:hypothetical protein